MKTLAFVSGLKGGTGKTTMAVNAAAALSYALRDKARYPVVLLDITPGVGTAAMLLFGSHKIDAPSLTDYLDGRLLDPLQAFYLRRWQTPAGEFHLVFSFLGGDVGVSRRALEALLGQLDARLKPLLVVLDAPPMGRGAPVQGLTDYVVPIVSPDASAIATAAAAAKSLGGKRLKPILNMHIKDYAVAGVYGKDWPDIVKEAFGEEPHVVPFDPLFEASRQALEIESLKLSARESPALASLLEYLRYLLAQLSS